MLHWNLHKEFQQMATRFEQEMMEAYGYKWINGNVDFSNEVNQENIQVLENN